MKLTPRTPPTLLAALLACVAPQAARAQAPGAAPARTRDGQSARKGADRRSDAAAARARREVRDAVAALREVAEDARSFDDLYESARAQSAAAHLLWPHDAQTARGFVRRAWEATHAPGAEGRVGGLGLYQDPDEDARHTLKEARVLIIEATAKHDARLAEEFMRELERDLPDDPEETTDQHPAAPSTHRNGGRSLSKADLERIRVARSLASAGDFKAAAGVVAPLVARGPAQPLLDFILGLRAGDARAGDALCLRLLEVTRADPTADANDVLTLSMPFVSPRLYVLVGADGSPAFSARIPDEDERRAPPLPAELRAAFYATAASVLLRQRAPAAGGGPPGDAGALYFAIGRLLPFFEREAAQHAPALHARRGALTAEMDAPRRESVETSAGVRNISVQNPVDPLAPALAEVALSVDAPGRDFARLRAVVTAARHTLWERARRVADEIEDAETRRGARLVIAVRQVLNTARAYDDGDADDLARAANFVRSADVPPEVRAVGLAQAAGLAASLGRRARAAELLAEAAAHAVQAERGERRVASLALVALAAERAEPARLWELLTTLASAAQEVDELPFDALNLEFVVGGEKGRFPFLALDPPVNLPEVFAAAARLDATRALAEARSLKDEALRTESLLYAARAALEKHAGVAAAPGR